MKRQSQVFHLAATIFALIVVSVAAWRAYGQAEVKVSDAANDSASKELDPSPSRSFEEAQSPRSGGLIRVMFDGGPLMWPIAGCSIVLTVFVFERLISLRKARVIPAPFVKRFLELVKTGKLSRDDAMRLCRENRSPIADVFLAAAKKMGRPTVEVEQALIDSGERVMHDLRCYLRLFSGIAQVAPLLGLLGTVLGMIESFNAISSANAMGRGELLAGGIGQALLTTAGGLAVAIPALIAYMFFVSRVESLMIQIDEVAQPVVDVVSMEGLERFDREGIPRTVSKKPKAAA